MSRELLQQALDALETHVPYVYKDRGYPPIEALRTALAQPEPEPIGEVLISTDPLGREGVQVVMWAKDAPPMLAGMKLYATPPAAPIDGFGGNLDEAFERAPAVREPQEHIGWCRYVTAHEKATRLVLCDSDAPGAFRVYRGIGGGGK